MPPTTDNPTEPVHDDSDEAWARWEQTFRNAKPVLPEAAMARIQAAIRREADPAPSAPASRLRRRIFLLVATLIAINIGLFSILYVYKHYYKGTGGQTPLNPPAVSSNVMDSYPLDVPIGPALVTPGRPILPLAENWQWISSEPPRPPSPPIRIAPDILQGAERLVAASPDGWHALGLLEMRRAAKVSAALAAPGEPNVQEFRLDALWREVEDPTLDRFCDDSRRLSLADLHKGQRFWNEVFKLLRAWHDHDAQAAASVKLSDDRPEEFPSKAAERARFDLLLELGVTQPQAALDVLTTRSYEPLGKLRELDGWPAAVPLREKLHQGYLDASHELIERLFALRLQGRGRDAEELLARAQNLRYLVNPGNLDVLLVRLGPVDAWEKFLRPLMDDEVGFINSPPQFDESRPRPQPPAIVQAAARSDQAGTLTYTGAVKLSAGTWRITCEKLTVLRSVNHGTLLKGSGNMHVRGVIGLLSATADEMTFNTETGELKLTGRVHLDQWNGNRDAKACTIIRTGELRDVEP